MAVRMKRKVKLRNIQGIELATRPVFCRFGLDGGGKPRGSEKSRTSPGF